MTRRRWAILVVTALICAPARSATVQLPHPSTGVVNGIDATYVWPGRYTGVGKYTLLDASACRAHVAGVEDLSSGRIHKCGAWFVPPRGKHRVWLEGVDAHGNDYISPEPLVLTYEPVAAGRPRGMIAPVVKAGFVAVSNRIRLGPGESIRVISAKTEFFAPTRAFDRPLRDIREPARVPAGIALVGVFDENGNAHALERPLPIRAGTTASAEPRPPERNSDVFAILKRPIQTYTEPVTVSLGIDGEHRAPDLLIKNNDRLYAVWYGVAARQAVLTAESASAAIVPVTLTLRPGRITSTRHELRRKPVLDVSVIGDIPSFENVDVTVMRNDEAREIHRQPVPPDGRLQIQRLPAESLRVKLLADTWEFSNDVDLTAGDAGVVFVLEPIRIHGTVYRGIEPAQAKISFGDGMREAVSAVTDDRGEYRAVLWTPASYVAEVRLADRSSPFVDPALRVERSGRIDFHLPENRVSVRVVDARTGRAIPDAKVGVQIVVEHPGVGAMDLAQRYPTDRDGLVVLPPLWAGTARIVASAPGYESSPSRTLLIEGGTEETITLALEKIASRSVRIVLFDGRPAAGAEGAIVVGERSVWRGNADQNGVIEIAAFGNDAALVLRHPQAASIGVPLPPAAETIAFRSPPAEPPLAIRTTTSDGEPVTFALITIWIDGVRLTGGLAAFAAWNPAAMSDHRGLWTAHNLPAAQIAVLATKEVPPMQLATGAYDQLARTVPYPRPNRTIDVPVVR